jgi:tight adherence protein C
MAISLVSAISAFLAAGCFVLWLARRSTEQMEARVKALAAQRRGSLPLGEVPFAHRVLVPLAEGLVNRAINLLPPAFIARTRRRLVAAGEPMSLPTFLTLLVVTGTLLPAAAFAVMWVASDGSPAAGAYLLVPLFAVIGALLSFLWLSRQVRGRQRAIWKSLPDAFDLMTTCVEAGLGLDASFHLVSEKLAGPVSEEFAELLREIGMGKARRDALRDMADRTDVADLETFAHAIVQAEELGTSLGTVLRVQASQLRLQRRQRAEEEARRAPAKMVFPLIFFILPSLFVVILGPTLIEVFKAMTD